MICGSVIAVDGVMPGGSVMFVGSTRGGIADAGGLHGSAGDGDVFGSSAATAWNANAAIAMTRNRFIARTSSVRGRRCRRRVPHRLLLQPACPRRAAD